MLIQYVEEALSMLDQKIKQHGTGFTYDWYISAASSLLRAVSNPGDAVREKEEAIGRVTRQYYQILAWQEELSKARDAIVPAPLHGVRIHSPKFLCSMLAMRCGPYLR